MRRLQVVLMVFVAVWMIPGEGHALTWEFDTDGNTEGWRTKGDARDGGGNSTDLTVEAGVLRVPVERGPSRRGVSLVSPRMELDASLYDRLIVRVRTIEGEFVGSFSMQWLPADAPTAGSTARLQGREIVAYTHPEYPLWTAEWQEFQFAKFVEKKGWSGQIVRFSMHFGFPEEDPEHFPEEIWIDFVTLTGVGAELLGDPAKVFYEGTTGTVFRVKDVHKVDPYLSVGTGGDVDGDGDLDLILQGGVIVEQSSNTWVGRADVWFNRGDGAFESVRAFETGTGNFFQPHLADLDGDGDLDLVGTNYMEGEVLTFLNQGEGRFVEGPRFGSGFGQEYISPWVGDLDGDGASDIAMSVAETTVGVGGTLRILMNGKDGTFIESDTHSVAGTPGYIVGGDLDGDGDVDLLVNSINTGLFRSPGSGIAPDVVFVFLNNGDGTFISGAAYPVGTPPSRAAGVGDFDDDGDLDLATVNTNEDRVMVLLNEGDGRFVPGSAVDVGHQPSDLLTMDFDSDGTADLTVSHQGDVNVWLLCGRGDGTFQKEGVYAVTGSAWRMYGGDMDGDGDLDLAVSDVSGSNVVTLVNTVSERTTIVDEDGSDAWIPRSYRLYSPYPNPFNASATIRYDLPSAGRVRLSIYNVTGQWIRMLVDEMKPAGSYRVIWDAKDEAGREMSSGMYLCRLENQTEDVVFSDAQGMVLLR